MRRRDRLVIGVLATVCVLPACSEAAIDGEGTSDPVATVESIDGSEVSRVILREDAAERLGVETGMVETDDDGVTTIPYAAVLYDPTGRTWAYTNPAPLTYVRAEITIDAIRRGDAVISSGPPVGTSVVTVGASELLGTEYEVAEE
jgi:hypothetical protein